IPACGRSSARVAATEASGSSRASTSRGSRASRSRSSATATRRRCSARRWRWACWPCTAPWSRTTWRAASPSAPPRTCKPCSPTPRGAGRRRRRSRSGPAKPPGGSSAAASRCWRRRSAPPGRPTPTARSSSSRTSPSGRTAWTACSRSYARRASSSASRASSSAPWRRARRSTAWARSTSCARASATCPARSPSACPRDTLRAAPARRTWRSPSASRSRSTPSAGASPRSRRRSSDVDFAGVGREIEQAAAAGAFPGAVILVSRAGRVLYHAAFGCRSLEPARAPMQPDTIFDLSSLTKPLATVTAFMLLLSERKVQVDDRVTRFFHNFGVHGKTHVTFRHLLAHCSGLPGWRPFAREVVRIERQGRLNFIASRGAKEFVYEQIHRERPEYETGERAVYSDLGFMLLGELIELVSRMPLDRFCHERIFRPLGLRASAFVDVTALRTRKVTPVTDVIAPTERCPWRKRLLCGEVHDDNAYAMGGVAGHAGLFSSARDIHTLMVRLNHCFHGKDNFLPQSLVQEFLTKDQTIKDSTHALGWDTPSPGKSASGSYFSPRSVGHLG